MSDINWDEAPEWATDYASHSQWFYWVGKKGYSCASSPECFYEFGSFDESTEYYLTGDFTTIEKRPSKPVTLSPIYTQEMRDNGELPPIGSEVGYNTHSEGDVTGIVKSYKIYPSKKSGDASCRVFIYFKSNSRLLGDIKPITPPKTDEEKTIDDILPHSLMTIKEMGKLIDLIKAGKIHNVTWSK